VADALGKFRTHIARTCSECAGIDSLPFADALARWQCRYCGATDPVALVLLGLFRVGVVVERLRAIPVPRLAHLPSGSVHGKVSFRPSNRVKVVNYFGWWSGFCRLWLLGV
jgi:hypothetical protein